MHPKPDYKKKHFRVTPKWKAETRVGKGADGTPYRTSPSFQFFRITFHTQNLTFGSINLEHGMASKKEKCVLFLQAKTYNISNKRAVRQGHFLLTHLETLYHFTFNKVGDNFTKNVNKEENERGKRVTLSKTFRSPNPALWPSH